VGHHGWWSGGFVAFQKALIFHEIDAINLKFITTGLVQKTSPVVFLPRTVAAFDFIVGIVFKIGIAFGGSLLR